MGFTVTITGGVTPADLATFANHPVGIVIAGRSIVAAKDPLAAATELQQAIARVWPS
jgi:3-dehydro-L-gulonate-6-phosphate decarboxylase